MEHDDMEIKALPIAEVRSLLVAVYDHGKQHLIEVETDLLQMTYLLNEAIEKLDASFMAVHDAVTNQQKILEVLSQRYHFAAEETEQLDKFNQVIGQEVNLAITSLQFQDLTSQLLVRTIKRVNGLKVLLHELAIHGDEIDTDDEHKEIAKILDAMSHSLHTGSHALSGGLRRSVDQQTMISGAIELF